MSNSGPHEPLKTTEESFSLSQLFNDASDLVNPTVDQVEEALSISGKQAAAISLFGFQSRAALATVSVC
jgi:hypothetical protein